MSAGPMLDHTLAFIARDISVRIHRHYCLQLIVALDGRFSCITAGEHIQDRRDLAINQNVTHRCAVHEGEVLVCFIEAQSAAGRMLRERMAGRFTTGLDSLLPQPVRDPLLLALREARTPESKRRACAALLQALAPAPAPRAKAVDDPRIAGVLAWMDAHLEQRLSLDKAARVAGLSAERTRHLFAAQVGAPYSQFLRWRRTLRAVQGVLQHGQSLTEASLAAGFADQAHFCNAFSRTFGIAAKGLLRNSRNIQFLNPLIV